jgi:hypothetical protein
VSSSGWRSGAVAGSWLIEGSWGVIWRVFSRYRCGAAPVCGTGETRPNDTAEQ